MRLHAPKGDELLVWLYAAGAYALALIGAAGFAWLLRLDMRTGLIFVGTVAVIALFGSAIPILRLGYTRLRERREREAASKGGEPASGRALQ